MNKYTIFCVALFFATQLLSAPSRATTRTVPTAYGTIQAAVDAAVPGDTIWLEPGVYTGIGNKDVDLLGKPLTITSIHRDSTVIDCQLSGRALYIHSAAGQATVISNLTIRSGAIAEGSGQGILISSSTVCIHDARIEHCGHDMGGNGGGIAAYSSTVRIFDTELSGSDTPWACGGNIAVSSTSLHMERCQVTSGGTLTGAGGLCVLNGFDVLIIDCLFAANDTGNACCGGAIGSEYTENDIDIFGTIFTANYSAQGVCIEADIDSLVSSVLVGNGGFVGFARGLVLDGDANYIAGNTIKNNGGVSCVEDGSLLAGNFGEVRDNLIIQSSCWGVPVIEGSADVLRYNTFVFDTLEPNSNFVLLDTTVASNNIYYDLSNGSTMFDGPPGFARISCSTIYNPSGIIGPAFVDDGRNSFRDPLFCDYGGEDFSLSSISPCLSASCGQIGAFGHGCWGPLPGVVEVSDVGNDQGRQARLKWLRSEYDAPGQPEQITGYSIYRREGPYWAAPGGSPIAPPDYGEQPFLLSGWDHLEWVPAYGDSLYQVVVPTLCDSTVVAGVCWSAFMVRASTSDPFTYFDSPPDSGYSTDDLAPAAPQNVVATYNTGSGNHLAWDIAQEPDVNHYNVYRGLMHGFDIQDGELVAQTGATQFTDPSYDGWPVHYMVTSVDHSGNEGAANGPAGMATAVPSTPRATTLYQNWPNPFNPSTTIGFSVTSRHPVTITIYDVRGKVVRRLYDGTPPSIGYHEVRWDGLNERGAFVGSGVYFYRMQMPGLDESKRMVVVR